METELIANENETAIKNTAVIRWPFILAILLIYPLPQVAIDIYLPSWPAMVNALHTSVPLLQTSLTIYILFLGISQLFYGPCSDRFGRKPVLLIGCSIFLISSVAAIFITSINQLLLLRAVQGIGMGSGFSVASAVLADTFTGKRLAQMTAYSAMVYSLSGILAPLLGGYLQHYIGWQANFFAMAIYALTLIILLYLFVFETNQQPDKSAIQPKSIVKNYLVLLSDFRFTGNVICLMLLYGIMITFSVIGPFILQNVLHVNEINYGKLLLIVGLSYFVGATITSHLLKRFKVHAIIIAGFGIITISSLSLLIASTLHWFTPTSIILFTSLSIFGIGFVFPSCFANALEVFPTKGTSGAFIGSAILIGTSIISVFATYLHIKNEYSLAYIYLTLTIFSILAYLLTRMVSGKRTVS